MISSKPAGLALVLVLPLGSLTIGANIRAQQTDSSTPGPPAPAYAPRGSGEVFAHSRTAPVSDLHHVAGINHPV